MAAETEPGRPQGGSGMLNFQGQTARAPWCGGFVGRQGEDEEARHEGGELQIAEVWEKSQYQYHARSVIRSSVRVPGHDSHDYRDGTTTDNHTRALYTSSFNSIHPKTRLSFPTRQKTGAATAAQCRVATAALNPRPCLRRPLHGRPA